MPNKLLRVFIMFFVIGFPVRYAFSDGVGNLTAPNKHNLSITGPGPIKALSETQICVFCHTPHAALIRPLWNHELTQASYTVSLPPGASGTQLTHPSNPPDGDSKLCLSCHDGTVPLGSVQNLGGQATTISMGGGVGLGPYADPLFSGLDLSGHHLVSIEINAQLVNDKNTQCQSGSISYTVKSGITKPYIQPTQNVYPYTEPLPSGTRNGVQCTSCHDPHYDNPVGNKFLRQGADGSWTSVNYTDPLCLSCHAGPCPL